MLDYWIDRLEDPFEMFAMQSVTRSLGSLAGQQEQRRFDRSDWWGFSYYTVEDEHDIEVVENLIGSAFVLAQAAISQAVSIIKRMHEDAGSPQWIPKDKVEIMKTAAPLHAETRQSKITLVNVAADYYKHRYEWKDEEWVGPTYKNKTIAAAAAMAWDRVATTTWRTRYANSRFILTTWLPSHNWLSRGVKHSRITSGCKEKRTASLFDEDSQTTPLNNQSDL